MFLFHLQAELCEIINTPLISLDLTKYESFRCLIIYSSEENPN